MYRRYLFYLLILFFVALHDCFADGPQHSFSYFGQPKYKNDFSHFDYVNPNAPKGGEIAFGVEGSYSGFNVFTGKNTTPYRMDFTYDTMMLKSGDEYMTFYPLIASSYEVKKEDSCIIVNLNPAARWSDGRQITAKDVVFTLETYKSYGSPMYMFFYSSIKNAVALSDSKVQFFLKKFNYDSLMAILRMTVLPEHYYKEDLSRLTSGVVPPAVTSGPYVVDSYSMGHSVVYKRNKNYWAQNLPVNIGRNNFDRIVVNYYRNDTVAVEAFKIGECDVRFETIAKRWFKDYDIPSIKNGTLIKRVIPYRIPQGAQGFIFNSRRPFLSDANVRKALMYVFDFRWINRNLMYDSYERITSHFHGSPFATNAHPTKDELEILSGYGDKVSSEVFGELIVPNSSARDNFTDSFNKAINLLMDSGYRFREGKLLDASGNQVTIELLISSVAFKRLAVPYIRSLERLGIKAELTVLELLQYKKRVGDFDYDIIMDNYPGGSLYVNIFSNYFHSSGVNRKGGANYAGVNDVVVDDLLRKINESEDCEYTVNLVRSLDRVLLAGHYMVPHWVIPAVRVLYKDKFGIPPGDLPYGWETDYWWEK